jgi:hypothetical protein
VESAAESFPGNCRGVISVGAVDELGNLTTYSAREADINMPGGTIQRPVPCVGPYMSVQQCIGTSVAVPHAAGLNTLVPLQVVELVGTVGWTQVNMTFPERGSSYVSANIHTSSIESCPMGGYMTTGGYPYAVSEVHCAACPPGTNLSIVGSTSISDCQPCSPWWGGSHMCW